MSNIIKAIICQFKKHDFIPGYDDAGLWRQQHCRRCGLVVKKDSFSMPGIKFSDSQKKLISEMGDRKL